MADIEKCLVKKAFSRHAVNYESLALVQRRVADRFYELFIRHGDLRGSLLDVGSGTGSFVHALRLNLPHVSVTGIDLAFGMLSYAKNRSSESGELSLVCGDAETLPFADCSFDVVVSTSTFQWLRPLGTPFAEVWRVLKPGGRFFFSLFGARTLFELRDSYQSAARLLNHHNTDRTHEFADCPEVQTALHAASFIHGAVSTELEIETYPDVYSLLHAVNGIGAGSAARSGGTGLSGRRLMLQMMEIYQERHGVGSVIPATYQVIYGEGTRP